MNLQLLPSPGALKKIFVAFEITGFMDGADSDELDWEALYREDFEAPENDEYDFLQEHNSDRAFLTFHYGKDFSYVFGSDFELGRSISEEEKASLPQAMLDHIHKSLFEYMTFFIWSEDNVHWNQLEEQCDPLSEQLNVFVANGVFADPEDGKFEMQYPVSYRIYKGEPLDDDMAFELALASETPESVLEMELPEPEDEEDWWGEPGPPFFDPESLKERLRVFGCPERLSDDYRPAATEEHADELLARRLYRAAAYVLGRILPERTEDVALWKKTAEACCRVKWHAAAVECFRNAGMSDDPACRAALAALGEEEDDE